MNARLSNPPPTSLRAAFERDKQVALDKHRRGVERIADAMTVPTHVLYKWLESGRMPASCLTAWADATGSDAVLRHLAAQGHKLVIDLPRARAAQATDVQHLQRVLHAAVGALIDFAAGATSAEDTIAALTHGMEALACQREAVRKQAQAQLELDA